ncbi:uncharacterized protein [Euwallacea similis]|uniref:uncharacterized protein n=1 Tax=Euwallacea similis TaxID=1736056 RepID=UPI00344ED819
MENTSQVTPTSEVGLPVPAENSSTNNSASDHAVPSTSQVEVLLKKIVELQSSAGTSSQATQVQLPSFDPRSKFADPEGWCCLVDEFVRVHQFAGINLVTCLSSALKGEAADWLIRCRPLGKTWEDIRTEFLSSFSKPIDIMELFAEAVNGRISASSETTLLDEGLHVLRLALHMIKGRESDEALATLFACHVVGNRSETLRQRLREDTPKDLKSFCVALRGLAGKRPALFRHDPHINPKQRAFTPSNRSDDQFLRKCRLCGKIGHKGYQCRARRSTTNEKPSSANTFKPVTCFKCGKSGHISTSCPDKERGSEPRYVEKRVNLVKIQTLPSGQLETDNDAFTKFVMLYHISSLSGKQAVESFRNFTYVFGAPQRIVSDQGKCFTSSEFRKFCTDSNIELHFVAHSASRANGQAKRVMQVLKNLLTIVETEGNRTWQDSLSEVQLALNSSVMCRVGITIRESKI